MKKSQYIITAIAFIAFPSLGKAQSQVKDSTMNRTVVVEQDYNPDIMDASKVNVVPTVEPPSVSKNPVKYDASLVPSGQIPPNTMKAYTGKEVQDKSLPGYARLGYGNYGNLDAQANYRFALPSNNELNLSFNMNGMNGKLDQPDASGKWDAHYYRTRAGLDYLHAFRKLDFNAAVHFGLSNFNFRPERDAYGNQKFSSGDVHFGVKSTDDNLPVQFTAETNLMFYQRKRDIYTTDTKENMIRTKANVFAPISENQHIGLALTMDNVFYKNNVYDNYTSLQLNPYFLFQTEDWKMRLAAHTDLAFGFGKSIRIAPDFTAQYTFSDSYMLYAQATGGRQTNDFRRLEALCPYGEIGYANQLDATYEQLNAALGMKASPLTGLWFNLYGGYQDLKNDLYQYPTSITLPADGAMPSLLLQTGNTHNVYAGLEMSYDYKSLFTIAAKGIYRNWTASDKTKEDHILYFKPSFEGNIHVDFHPVSTTLVNIGFQYTKREDVQPTSADAVENLYVGGSYNLFKGISIYARVNNLLNKDYQYYVGYPSEGFNFVGGVSFQF